MGQLIKHLRFVPAVVARYLVAAVFIVSVVGKSLSSGEFIVFVKSFEFLGFLPPGYFLILSIGLEGVLAGLLIYPATARVGAKLAFCALLVFTCFLIGAAFLEGNPSCGCFGELIGEFSNDLSILRNMVLLLLSVLAYQFTPSPNPEG